MRECTDPSKQSLAELHQELMREGHYEKPSTGFLRVAVIDHDLKPGEYRKTEDGTIVPPAKHSGGFRGITDKADCKYGNGVERRVMDFDMLEGQAVVKSSCEQFRPDKPRIRCVHGEPVMRNRDGIGPTDYAIDKLITENGLQDPENIQFLHDSVLPEEREIDGQA